MEEEVNQESHCEVRAQWSLPGFRILTVDPPVRKFPPLTGCLCLGQPSDRGALASEQAEPKSPERLGTHILELNNPLGHAPQPLSLGLTISSVFMEGSRLQQTPLVLTLWGFTQPITMTHTLVMRSLFQGFSALLLAPFPSLPPVTQCLCFPSRTSYFLS